MLIEKAWFMLATKLARKLQLLQNHSRMESLFTDCLITAAEEICLKQVNAFQSLGLSHSIAEQCISETGNNLEAQLAERMKMFTCYSLAPDDSTDHKYKIQLTIFIRGIDSDCTVYEYHLLVVSIKVSNKDKIYFLLLYKLLKNLNFHRTI